MKKQDNGFFSKTSVFFMYCVPGLIAVAVVVGLNYTRRGECSNEILRYIKAAREGKAISASLKETDDNIVLKRMEKYIEKQKFLSQWEGKCEVQIKREIRKQIRSSWLMQTPYIVVLTILPFIILGSGIAFSKKRELSLSEKKRIIFKDIPMKFLVGFVISMGWIYFFNPFGQGASTVYSFLKSVDIVSSDTVPIFLIFTNSPIKHIISGFLGWYLYLLGYFFFRFYRSDIVSTRIYSVLFRRFLFVFGAALILNSVASDEALLVIFLIGFFPISAVSALKEFLSKKVESAGENLVSLAVLPGISRWEILRLEEEGVDSMAALAVVDRDVLKQNLPVRSRLIDLWVDMAVLIVVVGEEKYREVRQTCFTASEFVNKSKKSDFQKFLKEKFKIYNAPEIAEQIQTTFQVPEKERK